jgi:hypothetical protein
MQSNADVAAVKEVSSIFHAPDLILLNPEHQ